MYSHSVLKCSMRIWSYMMSLFGLLSSKQILCVLSYGIYLAIGCKQRWIISQVNHTFVDMSVHRSYDLAEFDMNFHYIMKIKRLTQKPILNRENLLLQKRLTNTFKQIDLGRTLCSFWLSSWRGINHWQGNEV